MGVTLLMFFIICCSYNFTVFLKADMLLLQMCTVTLYTLNMVKDSLMMTLASRNMSL